jgi:hypothetical protein
MSAVDLEGRVSALELRYAELLKLLQDKPAAGAWRKVVGLFANDANIDELHRETQRIRQEDRLAAGRDVDP